MFEANSQDKGFDSGSCTRPLPCRAGRRRQRPLLNAAFVDARNNASLGTLKEVARLRLQQQLILGASVEMVVLTDGGSYGW